MQRLGIILPINPSSDLLTKIKNSENKGRITLFFLENSNEITELCLPTFPLSYLYYFNGLIIPTSIDGCLKVPENKNAIFYVYNLEYIGRDFDFNFLKKIYTKFPVKTRCENHKNILKNYFGAEITNVGDFI